MSIKTLQITLQHPRDQRWSVSATLDSSDGLPYRQEDTLELSANWQAELLALALQPDQYGAYLGKALFHAGIRDITKNAASSADPVHVFLNVEAPELQPLRWERLCFPDELGRWVSLAQHQHLIYSRYFPSLVSRQYPVLSKHNLRALVFIASPAAELGGFKPFDTQAMQAALQQSLSDIPATFITDPQQATWENLLRTLNQQHYPILHIVAHGFYNAPLAENALIVPYAGKPSINASELIEQLARIDKLPNLIFLSSCETATPEASQNAHDHLARRLLDELGTPATVAMSDKVQIETARLLSEHFYAYLYTETHVDTALAKAGIELSNRSDRHLPVLYQRLGSRPLFTREAKPLNQLDGDEILEGLHLLGGDGNNGGLLDERAPIMRAEYAELVRQLDAQHPAPLLLERLDILCQEVCEIGFAALAQGEPVNTYQRICPFPGMRPFKASDNGEGTDYRQFFFGRDAKVAELVQRLEQIDVLVIKGASGSGKSSIVYAGILPALEQLYQAAGKPLQSVTLRPRCIRNADLSMSSPDAQLQAAVQPLDAEQDAIIFVDQFEELFTTCQFDDPHQQKQVHQQFLDALLGLPKQHPRWKVILTIRADFIGDCAPYENLRRVEENQSTLLPPMTLEELRTAIEKQAESVGLILEQGLLHAILDEVEGQPGAMPLLQYLLWLLWKRRRGRYLRMEEYEKIQQVGNAIADIAESHYRQYDANPLTQSYLRNIYLRLTRPDTDRQKQAGAEKYRDTRQRINQSELYPEGADPQLIRQLIQELADGERRLVVTHEDEVEIAHETLIQHWPRLNSWLNDSSLNLIRQSIAESTRVWKAETSKHRANSLLTHTGTRLQDIEQYKQQGLLFSNPQEEAYLQACYAKDKREARNQRYVRLFAVAMLLLFLVAGWVSWLAIGQKNRADDRLAEQHFQKGIELRDNQYQEWGKAEQYFAKALDVVADKIQKANIYFAYADLHRFGFAFIGESVIPKDEDDVLMYAKDGRVLKWGGDTAQMWDIAMGKPVSAIQHEKRIEGATLFANDTRVLTWNEDGAWIWETTTGNQVGQPIRHGGRMRGAQAFTNGMWVLTWDEDTARVWDITTGRQISQIIDYQDGFDLLAGNSRFLVWRDDGGESSDKSAGVQVLDAAGGKPLTDLKLEDIRGECSQNYHRISGVLLFDDDKKVLTWNDELAQVWDASTGIPSVSAMCHEGNGRVLGARVFAGDTRILTWSGGNGTARVWNAATGEPIGKPMRHEGSVEGTALFAEDSRVLTWSKDWINDVDSSYRSGYARVWDAATGEPITQPIPHERVVEGARVFADDTHVLTWGDSDMWVWDATQVQQHNWFEGEARIFAGNTPILTWDVGEPIEGATMFAGDTRVLTWSTNGTAQVWDAASGNPISEPMRYDGSVGEVQVLANDTRVLIRSNDGTARVWDAATGNWVEQPIRHENEPVGAKLFTGNPDVLTRSSDGVRVLIRSNDGTARVWDAVTGNPIGEPIGHNGSVNGMQVFADDTRVLTWSNDGVRVWDFATGRQVGLTMQHKSYMEGAILFAKDTRVLTWDQDSTLQIWDAVRGEPIGLPMMSQPESTNYWVRGVQLFAGDTKALTWSEDGMIRIWNLPDTQEKNLFLREIKQSIQNRSYINTAGDLIFLKKEQLEKCKGIYIPFEECDGIDTFNCTFKRQWWSVEKFLGKLPTIENCLKE